MKIDIKKKKEIKYGETSILYARENETLINI